MLNNQGGLHILQAKTGGCGRDGRHVMEPYQQMRLLGKVPCKAVQLNRPIIITAWLAGSNQAGF